jgi:hypothetical protein
MSHWCPARNIIEKHLKCIESTVDTNEQSELEDQVERQPQKA